MALYHPAEHQSRALCFGDDQWVATPFFRSKALWVVGYPKAALVDIDQALKYAREIGHATSLLWALIGSFFIDIICGNYASASGQMINVLH